MKGTECKRSPNRASLVSLVPLQVVFGSNGHFSSGSTVATFLDQGDIVNEHYEEVVQHRQHQDVVFQPPLPTVPEDGNQPDSEDANSGDQAAAPAAQGPSPAGAAAGTASRRRNRRKPAARSRPPGSGSPAGGMEVVYSQSGSDAEVVYSQSQAPGGPPR